MLATPVAAPVPAAAPAAEEAAAPLTAKERMANLKELLDDGLVSADEYEARRQEIIASL